MTGKKTRNIYNNIFLTAVFAAQGMLSFGQTSYHEQRRNAPLFNGQDLFSQQHFALAAQSARQFLDLEPASIPTVQVTDQQLAAYIAVISGLKTGNPGSVENAKKFINTTTNTAYRQRTTFSLAQYYFLRDDLVNAIPLYEAAGLDNLSNAEITDAKFELAYCYFNNKQFAKANPLFLSIKEVKDGKYYMAGNYYYGLLAYNANDLNGALKSFDRIRDNKDYKKIVPYYVAEIYYFLGDRKKALEEVKNILAGKEKSYYDNDLHLLAAQCLFEDEKYSDAKPYFDYYYDHVEKIRKEDLYKMGYCHYRLNEWDKAIEKFKILNSSADSMGQSSMYLLGDCYLKMDNRTGARNAFSLCAEMPYNKRQQEDALILYARLSFEAGFDRDALESLKTLLASFPESKYGDEARTLISGLLLSTNNFTEALKYLESVTSRDRNYKLVHQKANYGAGVQAFRNGELNTAYQYFNESVKYPTDVNYEACAYFWMGELAYRQHRYPDAISKSQEFINRKTESNKPENISAQATVQHAYLNMGFAAMDGQNFATAQAYFYKARQSGNDDEYSGMVANLKEADAVFMQQNYAKAISLYEKIISTDTANSEYAIYQKSIILGLQGKSNDKINALLALIRKTPPSVYATTARYEAAVTYIEEDKYPQAMAQLLYLTDTAADKSAAPKAWMKIGFIHQQENDNAKSINAYKHIITDFPASDERISALDALRSLYIQTNQPGAYAQLLRENNLPSAENSSIDSTYYSAAEGQYATGKWDIALSSFDNYLKQFPNGMFAIKAHYYRGECYYQVKKFKEALGDYDTVLSGKWNDFSENAAKHAAAISFDQKNYSVSYNFYNKLRQNTPGQNKQTQQDALHGLVKTAFLSEKYSESVLFADTLLLNQGLPADMINEALLYKARANQKLARTDTALELYKQLSSNKNGEIAAESNYHIAEILVQMDSLKDGEAAANETIRLAQGYDYWIVKSYILLADILMKQKDFFNARATLNSIIKHSKNAELKLEANNKLAELKILEKTKTKLKEE